eukprot:728064_1
MGLPNSNQLKPETLCNIYRMYVDQAAVVFYVIGQHIAVCIVGYDLLYGLITLSLVYKLMLLIVLCFKRLVFRMWFSDWMGSPFSIVGYGLSYGICSQFLYGGDAVFILLCEIVWVMWIYLVAVRMSAFSQCFVLYSHPLNPFQPRLKGSWTSLNMFTIGSTHYHWDLWDNSLYCACLFTEVKGVNQIVHDKWMEFRQYGGFVVLSSYYCDTGKICSLAFACLCIYCQNFYFHHRLVRVVYATIMLLACKSISFTGKVLRSTQILFFTRSAYTRLRK